MRILYVTILAAVSVYLFVSLRSLGSTPTPPKMATPAEFVKQTISETRVVVFSKTFCPYCKKGELAGAWITTERVAVCFQWWCLRGDHPGERAARLTPD